jgi:hypothetical protein
MKTFQEYCLLEMARPAKSFADVNLNNAYAQSLKMFKALGVDNANTYTAWDFMFRQLPEFFQQPEILNARKKAGGAKQRNFVTNLLLNHMDKIDANQLARDITDESKIRAYIDRPDRGNRHQGVINSQKYFNDITSSRREFSNRMGLRPTSDDHT